MEVVLILGVVVILVAAGVFFAPALRSRLQATEEERKIDISTIDLTISDLKVGDFVDFDAETFEVTKAYGNEWQLKNGNGVTFYLEREVDDEIVWMLSEKVEPKDFLTTEDLNLFNNDGHLAEIIHGDTTYEYDDEDDDELDGEPYYIWEYEGPDGTFLTLEQWEDGFEAAVGKVVNEYNFSNILRRHS